MRLIERKYFADKENGGLNADDAAFSVLPNQVVNMQNARFGSTDKGVINTIESIGSTKLLSAPQVSVSLMYHGGCEDIENSRIVYCLRDIYSSQHRIMCYDYRNDIIYTVLTNSQVTGGLNFQKDNFIHSCRINNGVFYFTDYYNEPRKVDIDAGIKLNQPSYVTDTEAYVSPLNQQVITIIRKPPNYPLLPTKKNATDVGLTVNTNQIKNYSFRFTYFYTYKTGERSTLSMHSSVVPYNYSDETYNVIQLQVPFSEAIDQDVQSITLAVIYLPDEIAFEIKTWDKSSTTDLAEIEAHNSLTTQLTFYFTNSDVGAAIDSTTLVKPFDSVPLKSKTLEKATQRIFLGNNLMGYNTPSKTSLTGTVTQQDTGGGNIAGSYVELDYILYGEPGNPDAPYTFTVALVYFPTAVDGTHPAGYYCITTGLPLNNPASDPSPTVPINISDYTFVGSDPYSDLMSYVFSNVDSVLGWTPSGIYFSAQYTYYAISASGSTSTTNRSVLKSDSARRIAIVFYDKYMRQCGIVKSSSGLITIPDRAYDFSGTYNYAIQWALSNADAFNEIPDWAYYYSIVSTKDLVRSYFIQARAGDIKYATKDTAGDYVIPPTATAYSNSNVGVALQLNLLSGYGMGYAFQAGDIVKVYLSGVSTVYTLSIISQQADWIIAENADLGSLVGANALFEIYSPRAQSAGQFYYEQGSIYPIINPTSTLRQYSATTGQIVGDIYLLTRGTSPSTYITENMSPSTTIWQNWITDAGRLQIEDRIGQQLIKTSIRWSNTYLEGTQINGLSSFDALDQKLLPIECGQLQKLQLTSKVQDQLGVVMLGICEKETASLYLGEVQLYGSNAESTLTQSPNVIGTVNVLKGSFGTVNPESVTEYRGNVYWADLLNGRYVQYSANGLFPISNYKMTRFWKLFSDLYLSLTTAQIEDLDSMPYIFSVVDSYHNELLISIPKLSLTPPKGYLPDTETKSEKLLSYDVRVEYETAELPLPGLFDYYGLYYYLPDAYPAGYYVLKSSEATSDAPPPAVTPPTSLDFSQLKFMGQTFDDVLQAIITQGATIVNDSKILSGSSIVNNITVYTVYPFDIWDAQEKTLVYGLSFEPNHWLGSMSFRAEGFISAENKLFSWKNGLLYIHNQTDSYNQFYGVSFNSRVMFVCNQQPTTPKVYDAIEVQANMIPTLTYFYNDYPYLQVTDLKDFDYRNYEGKFYAALYRNKLVPTQSGYTTDGLLTGEKIRAKALYCMLEFAVDEVPLELEFAEIKYSLSRGHNQI